MAHKSGVSRRQFVAAGIGTASAVLLASGRARAEEAKEAQPEVKVDIRAGMIGIGGRGAGVLRAVAKSPGVKVTALCDISQEALDRGAKICERDQPKLFKDYRAMLDYPELDAVFVETPCHLHFEMVSAALKAGKHVYGEKPMAIRLADLDALVRIVDDSKRVYQVGTQLPYGAPWKPSIELIRSGELGKPVFIRAHRHNAGDLPHHIPWFFKRETSGDTILEQAVHEFDIFNRVFGGIPVAASGFGGKAIRHEPEGRDIMDHYALALDYGKDKKVSYSHSWIAPPGIPKDGRQEIVYCENGAVDIEDGMVYPREGKPYKVKMEPAGDSTQLAVDDFFRCIREGDKPLCDVRAGRDGALVALLGRAAIDEGRVVTMKELLAKG